MADTMQTENFPYLPSGLAEVNKMIAEHSDLFSDSQCKVCSAVLISESQKLTHYQSKKHANKVRRYFFIQNENEPAFKKPSTDNAASTDCNNGEMDRYKACMVCNMTFTSSVMAQSHYQGKVHAKNLRLKTVGPQNTVAPPTPAPPAVPAKKQKTAAAPLNDKSNPNHFCSVCQASFNNPLMAQQHYQGKKHQKHMKKQKLMETYGPATAPATTVKGYPCSVCNLELNSVEQYQSHISGAKHKNQLKKSGLAPSDTLQASDTYSGENPGAPSRTAAQNSLHPLGRSSSMPPRTTSGAPTLSLLTRTTRRRTRASARSTRATPKSEHSTQTLYKRKV
uniref:Zinc finger protein 346 n=1 Tax=Neogobius melanostomus TaxID=47308 RepID=A0A8C6TGT8_9GOBI